MNKNRFQFTALICGLLATSFVPLLADEPTTTLPTASTPVAATAPVLATKIAFLSGLKEPQGLAFDKDGNLLVCDYAAGEVLRYSRDGKLISKLASGLKSPAQIVVRGTEIFVTERKANRVIQIGEGGKVLPIGEAIEQPLGLSVDARGELFAVSHTTSKIYRFDGAKWNLIFAAPLEEGDDKRYGYRCLAYDGGAMLMSDEVGEQVLMLTPGGRIATWATGIADPSGITIGPDGAAYVCNEGDGGQVLRMSNDGEATIVAADLGRPRNIVFLDAKTALVSDRNGSVWKLTFPAAT